MAKKQKQTRVLVLLDETGSMESVKQATMSGFDEYVATLKGNTTLTLVKFNSARTETVYRDRPIADVPKLTDYSPDHMTNLYDAIGAAIADQQSSLHAGDEVLFVIITDGEENSSKEWSVSRIKSRIQEMEAAGWAFVYIGAVLDAWAVGASIGVAAGNISGYDANKPQQAFRKMGLATSNYAMGNPKSRLLADDQN